jgi:3',5'-nucleoside bisphosphate phosphatase
MPAPNKGIVIVDFHTHTSESDGRLSPEALIAKVRGAGIDYFSITDHDTTAAYERHPEEFVPIAGRVIVGIEVSTHLAGRDVHLLAYGIPLGPSPLRDAIGDRETARWRRIENIIALLTAANVPLSTDDVRRETVGRIVNRKHVAEALVHAGHARDVVDAFDRYLGAGAVAYVPSTRLDPRDAIRAIRESGGVAVLAHPSRAGAAMLIEDLKRAGLAGLEVFYGAHEPHETERYRQTARELGLLMTAGSDFHEPTENRPAPGCDVEATDIEPFLKAVL